MCFIMLRMLFYSAKNWYLSPFVCVLTCYINMNVLCCYLCATRLQIARDTKHPLIHHSIFTPFKPICRHMYGCSLFRYLSFTCGGRRWQTVATNLYSFIHLIIIFIRRTGDMEDKQIIMADETACWFDFPSASTLEKPGKRTVYMKTTGNEKVR